MGTSTFRFFLKNRVLLTPRMLLESNFGHKHKQFSLTWITGIKTVTRFVLMKLHVTKYAAFFQPQCDAFSLSLSLSLPLSLWVSDVTRGKLSSLSPKPVKATKKRAQEPKCIKQ